MTRISGHHSDGTNKDRSARICTQTALPYARPPQAAYVALQHKYQAMVRHADGGRNYLSPRCNSALRAMMRRVSLQSGIWCSSSGGIQPTSAASEPAMASPEIARAL
jgi:hypothetical protein